MHGAELTRLALECELPTEAFPMARIQAAWLGPAAAAEGQQAQGPNPNPNQNPNSNPNPNPNPNPNTEP